MVQCTAWPGRCGPSDHRLGGVLCHCHHCPDAQHQSQGFVVLGTPGHALFPGSVPCHLRSDRTVVQENNVFRVSIPYERCGCSSGRQWFFKNLVSVLEHLGISGCYVKVRLCLWWRQVHEHWRVRGWMRVRWREKDCCVSGWW